MKNKAFTLVELLAVIVVLAVILIIAIPRVMNAIEESRKESFRITGENLIKGAQDKATADSIMSASDKTYTITDGAFVGDSFSISGELPDDGTIVVHQDGTTAIAVSKGDYCIRKYIDEENVSISKDSNCRIPTPVACFTYTTTATEVTITGYDNLCDKNVVIPSTIEDKPVTALGNSSFISKQLTSVIIPNSVTSIGSGVFMWNQLENATISKNITYISGSAFRGNRLVNVIIPDGVTVIDGSAFSHNQLTSVIIPDSVITISSMAFQVNQLTSVTIPSSVTSIGGYAFARNQLTSATIPSSVTSVGGGAFNDNKFPNEEAFMYARNIDGSDNLSAIVSYRGATRGNLVIPSGVTTILENSFSSIGLTGITIPNSVTSIESWAFAYNQLAALSIPNSVISIEGYSFWSNLLKTIVITVNEPILNTTVSDTFYTSYVIDNASSAGTYTAPSQGGTWTKQ